MKHIIPLLICTVFSIPIFATEHYGGGNGDPNDPFLIYTAEQFNTIGTDPNNWDKHFILMNDIDMSVFTGDELNLIGLPLHIETNPSFSGSFDGNNYNISNITIDTSTDIFSAGIFRVVRGENAVIKNLNLINTTVNAYEGSSAGTLAGVLYENARIENCVVIGGNVSGRFNCGGLVGACSINSTIINCSSSASVEGDDSVGGLTGSLSASLITNCHSTGNVTGRRDIGGLIGRLFKASVKNCYTDNNIEGQECAGGLVGSNDSASIIDACYSSSNVIVTLHIAGGLVGENRATIRNCYSNGTVHAEKRIAGGIAGWSIGYIFKCYSTAKTTDSGIPDRWRPEGAVTTGGITPGDTVDPRFKKNTMFCYWDTELTGVDHSSSGQPKTSLEMKQASTFTSWGCNNIWTIEENTNTPKLTWQNQPGEILNQCAFISEQGNGTLNNPYIITTAEQLNGIGPSPLLWDKHFKLESDIDLSDIDNFNVIALDQDAAFTGSLDGNHHTISNLSIGPVTEKNIGIFGYTSGSDFFVKNLTITDPNIIVSGSAVGSLIGHDESVGQIINCRVEGGKITGTSSVGGLIGIGTVDLTQCYSSCYVSGKSNIGGISGIQGGHVTNCISEATLIGESGVGGLFGQSSANISNCHTNIHITGSGGGLVGKLHAPNNTISYCYSSGIISGDFSNKGGLIGYGTSGKIFQCYSTCDVLGLDNLGGFIGNCDFTLEITECYATGNVIGNDSLGGFAAITSRNGQIQQCFATGAVTGQSYIGGFIGGNNGTPIRNCYSNGPVSGKSKVGGFIGSINGDIYHCYSTGVVSGESEIGGFGAQFYSANSQYYATYNCRWDIEKSGTQSSTGGAGRNSRQMTLSKSYFGWGCEDQAWVLDEENSPPKLAWENTSGIILSNCEITFDGGNGEPNDPFLISSQEQFSKLSYAFESNKHYKLTNDLILDNDADLVFTTIGIGKTPFQGTFDGNGHTISNLTLNTHGEEYAGVFGIIKGENTVIKNITLEYPAIHSNNSRHTGAIAGKIENSHISNCQIINGNISGYKHVGGLVGLSHESEITNCNVSADISASDEMSGGLIGKAYKSIITNCSSTNGNIHGQGKTGGLIGYNHFGNISNSTNTNYVNGTYYTGGLIGQNHFGNITNSQSIANVNGTSYTGGFIGENKGNQPGTQGLLTNCRSLGNVAGKDYTGGFSGKENNSTLEFCNSQCLVIGHNYVGGFSGYSSSVEGSFCSSESKVYGKNNHIGGLIGHSYDSQYNECFSRGLVKGETRVGGITGYVTRSIYGNSTIKGFTDCYSNCYVSGKTKVGSFIGEADNSIATRCYASGHASANLNESGGFVGFIGWRKTMRYQNVIWNQSKNTHFIPFSNSSGYTDNEMKQQKTYVEENWPVRDNSTWRLCEDGTDYPRLGWEIIDNAGKNQIVSIPTNNTTINVILGSDPILSDCLDSTKTFQWSIIEFPNNSSPIFNSELTILNPQVQLDTPGLYTFKLEINETNHNQLKTDHISVFVTPDTLGDGSTENPFKIYHPFQLRELAKQPETWDQHFELANDIDLSESPEEIFQTIGNTEIPFTGTFNGNHHRITNLSFDKSFSANNIGLFGNIEPNAVISHTIISEPNIKTPNADNAAALVGYANYGKIIQCGIENGRVIGNNQTAGLSGFASNTLISGCYSTASITGNEASGGLCGQTKDCTIRNNYSQSNIQVTDDTQDKGGLIGLSQNCLLTNCYAASNITGGTENNGGLTGKYIPNRIDQCYWDSDLNLELETDFFNLTTDLMFMKNTYTQWDCDIWTIDDGQDYPRLVWQNSPGTLINDCDDPNFQPTPQQPATYIAEIINPGKGITELRSIENKQIIGNYQQCEEYCDDYTSQGFLINKSRNKTVKLSTPYAYSTSGLATNGTKQLGATLRCYPEYDYCDTEAILWDKGNDQFIELHPWSFTSSFGTDASPNQQVGFGTLCQTVRELCDVFTIHALLWQGSKDSTIDLNPPEYVSSIAMGVHQKQQIGYGVYCNPDYYDSTEQCYTRNSFSNYELHDFWNRNPGEFNSHTRAILWHGAPNDYTDLHPEGFSRSFGLGIWENQQVGYGQICTNEEPNNPECYEKIDQALLWNGSAENVVNLHPSDYLESRALKNKYQFQVGYTVTNEYFDAYYDNPRQHAFVWQGSPESGIDLHRYLPNEYKESVAHDVDIDGTIVGSAWSNKFEHRVGVIWTFNDILPTTGLIEITQVNIKASSQRETPTDALQLKAKISPSYTSIIKHQKNNTTDISIRLMSATSEPLMEFYEELDANLIVINSKRTFINYSQTSNNIDNKINRLRLDLNKGLLTLSASNLDLSGFQSPLICEIQIGQFTGTGVAGENNEDYLASGIDGLVIKDVINGSKPLPINLMSGVQNILTAQKHKYKTNTKKHNSDSLMIQGQIVLQDFATDLSNEPIQLSWDDFSVTIPADSIQKKGSKYTIKHKSDNGQLSGTVDLAKASYKISLSKTSLDDQAYPIEFGLKFSNFNEKVLITE